MGMYKITLETSLDTKQLRQQLKQIENTSKIKIKVDSVEASNAIKNIDRDYGNWTSTVAKNGVIQRETYEKIANGIKTVTKVQEGNITQTTKAIKANSTFIGQLKSAFSNLSTYISAAAIVNVAKNAIEDMVVQVKTLDDSITELKKVTDLEGDSLDRFIDRAYEAGERVAKTGSEMVDAAAEFSKSGYNDDDALRLGEIALMYTNVADEELNAGDAASFIIAQMKAFNIEAEDSIHIVDALNEVSNNYAVSSADLSSSIGKVSSTMAVSNTTYEQTLGLLTATTEITRDAGKAANALKTISQRLRGVGDDIESTSGYVSKLQSAFDSLGIGIKVLKDNGEMASPYDILKAMADKWSDLTDAEKQYIGELAAGKNRITELNALMGNFEVAVSATETAMNSSGSAIRENEAALDSVQGHINKLSSAWQNLSRNVINSEFIKSVLDAGTTLIKFADSDIGKTVVAIMSLITAYKLLTVQGGKLIASNSGLMSIIAATTVSFKAGAYGATGFSAALKGTASATWTLTSALLANPLFWGTAIIGGLVLYVNHLKKVEQANLDLVSSIQKEVDALNDEQNALNSLSDELIDNYNSVDTLKEKRETLTKYQEKIIDKYKDEIENLTDVNKANDLLNMSYDETVEVLGKVEKGLLDKQLAQLNEDKTARDKLLNTETFNIFGNWSDFLTKDSNGVEKVKDEYKELLNTMYDIAEANNVVISKNIYGEAVISGNAENLVRFYDNMEESVVKLGEQSQVTWGEIKSNSDTIYNSIQEDYNKFSEAVQQEDEASVKKWIKNRYEEYSQYNKVLQQKQDLKKQYDEADTLSEKQNILDKIKEMQPSVEDAYKKLYDGASNIVKKSLDKNFVDFDISKMVDFSGLEDINVSDIDKLFSDIKKGSEDSEQLKKKILSIRNEIDALGDSNSLKYFDSQLVTLGYSVNNNAKKWEELKNNIASMEDYAEGSAELWKFIRDQGIENVDELSNELSAKLSSGEITFKEFFDYLYGLITEAGADVEEIIEEMPSGFETIISDFSNSIEGLEDRYSKLNSAVEEFNNTGGISAETFKDLTANDLLDYLTWTENGLIANTDALYSEADAAKISALQKLQSAYASDVLALSTGDLKSMSTGAEQAIENERNKIDGLGSLAAAQTGGLFSLASAQAAVNAAGGKLDLDKYGQDLEKLNDYYNRIAGSISNLNISTKSTSKSGSKKGSSSKSTKDTWKEQFEKEYAALKHQLNMNEITEKEYTDRLEVMYKKYFSDKSKYLDEYNKYEEEVYKNRKKLMEDEIDELEKVLKKQRELAEDKYDNAVKVATNAIDERIEALKKQKEALEENNDEQERAIELAKLQDELERAKTQKTMRVFHADRGWVKLCPAI